MKKLFMKGKTFLACILVLSVLSVSLFTGAVVTANAATGGKCGGTTIEKWDKVSDGVNINDWYDGTFESGDGSKDNPYIISSAEELAWVCKNTTVENSAGVYYKVDESIKAFDMNTVSGVDLTDETLTANEVYDCINGKILGKVWHPGYNGCFAGNFDGSGVTIYGLYAGPAYYNQNSLDTNSPYGCTNGGLFSKIDTSTASFKNFSIKNSYFTGDVSGAVFGDSSITGGSVSIENVVVANCYIKSTGSAPGGVIGGYLRYNSSTNTADKAKINNCLVYDNVVENNAGAYLRLIGSMEAYCDNGSGTKVRDYNGFGVSNTIAIGCAIENSGSYWQKDPAFYSNCYTTETPATENTTITKLANADAAKGVAASTNIVGLDKAIWFFNTSTYPMLRVMHDIKITNNENGTHIESCDCGLISNPVSHNFVNGSCSCGAVAKCGDMVSVYSGTLDTSLSGSGTADNPYLITSADEFAAVALGKIASTENTYFKVDGIDAFYMNGGVEVANMTSAEQVKTYFSTTSSLKNWVSSGPFIGQFDGNGITVYGLYAKHTGQYDQAALFPKVSGHSSIKNIAIKNSYISSYNKDGSIAALVGGTIWSGDSNADTSITLENIMVANNYIASTNDTVKTGASVLMGCFFEKHYAIVNNCLIYGNVVENAYTGAGLKSAMITTYNGTGATTKFNNIVSIGVTPWSVVDNKDGTYGSANWYISNIDSGHYTNIYTDQSIDPLQAYNPVNNADKYLEKFNINSLPISDMEGSLAVENLNTLGDAWIFSAIGYPELRVFHDDELDMEYAADNYAGHIESCSCGFITPVVEHDYNDNYKCIDCGFVCDHANADVDISGGDCLTAATKTVICSCGYENASPNGTAAGHAFIYKNEVPSENCLTQGTAAHNYCSVCKKNYAADADVMVDFDSALSDDDLKLAVGDHTQSTDENGIIYHMTETSHAFVCSVCHEPYDAVNHEGEFVPNGATGHTGECTVCGLGLSDEAGHNFDGNHCADCDWYCLVHNFEDGTDADDIISEGDCVADRVVRTYCTICGVEGEQNVTTAPGHTEGEVQIENNVSPDCDDDGSYDEVVYCTVCEDEISRTNVPVEKNGHTEGNSWQENHNYDCILGHSYELVTQCSVCFAEISRETITEEAMGHDLYDYSAEDASCSFEGWIAHTQCGQCGKYFEHGTTDIFSDDYLEPEDIYINPIEDAHKWIEVEEIEADCENDGTIGYKYCGYCYLFVTGENEIQLEIDFDVFWEELDPVLEEEYNRVWEEFVAENPEPGEDAAEEEWDEFNDAFHEIWIPLYRSIYDSALREKIILAAQSEEIVFKTVANGHTIVMVDEIPATYEADGTKAHYACECGKLYSDANGENEVTAESLVIAKLIKVDLEDNNVKPEGDTSDKSPATNDSLVSVAVVSALIGAAFIATKKFKSR